MRVFIMMVGIPGAGKTWLRRKAFYDAKVVCPDDRIGYTKDKPWTPRSARIAWDESDKKFASLVGDPITELLAFDATNTKAKKRRKYVERAIKLGFQAVAVFCNTEEKVCRERNDERSEYRKVPSNVIDQMAKRLETPDLSEGFHLVAKMDLNNRVYHITESEDCLCGDEIRERFKFLWGDAEHKSLTVIKK